MSTSLAIKLGAAFTCAMGGPSAYLVWDKYFSLYKAEKSILEEKVVLAVVSETDGAKVTADTSVVVEGSSGDSVTYYKWECKIIVPGITESNKSKLTDYLNKKLPASSSGTTNNEQKKKLENKEILVRRCARGRTTIEDNTYKSKIELQVNNLDGSSGSDISTDLFVE